MKRFVRPHLDVDVRGKVKDSVREDDMLGRISDFLMILILLSPFVRYVKGDLFGIVLSGAAAAVLL
jgi:hypothetical protein